MGIAELFSSIAPTYDRLNHLLSLNLDRRWRRRLAGLARIPPNARILDACTGTADLALELARRAPGARITTWGSCRPRRASWPGCACSPRRRGSCSSSTR